MHTIVSILIVFISLYNVVNSELSQEFITQYRAQLQKVSDECIKETNTPKDDVDRIVGHEMPTSKEGKCMIFCLQKKFHFMKEDGSMDKVGSVLTLNMFLDEDEVEYEKLLHLFIDCSDSAKLFDDPCETAAGLYLCGLEESKKGNINKSLMY